MLSSLCTQGHELAPSTCKGRTGQLSHHARPVFHFSWWLVPSVSMTWFSSPWTQKYCFLVAGNENRIQLYENGDDCAAMNHDTAFWGWTARGTIRRGPRGQLILKSWLWNRRERRNWQWKMGKQGPHYVIALGCLGGLGNTSYFTQSIQLFLWVIN